MPGSNKDGVLFCTIIYALGPQQPILLHQLLLQSKLTLTHFDELIAAGVSSNIASRGANGLPFRLKAIKTYPE